MPLYRYYPQAPSNEVAQKWADRKASALAARDKVPLRALIVRQRQANEGVNGVSGRWTHVVVIGTDSDLEAAKSTSLGTAPKVAAPAKATSSDEPVPEFEPEPEANGPPVDPSSPSSSDAAPSPPAAEEKPKRRRATR